MTKEKTSEINKGGAKGKFAEWITEDGLTKIEGYARDGLTDKQIAHNMGIGLTTLKEWKNRFRLSWLP